MQLFAHCFNITGLWLCLLAVLPARAQVADTTVLPRHSR